MVGPLMGAYVREAIRPHVTGSFAAMLRAVASARYAYQDNVTVVVVRVSA
jgi:uncharacterized protein (DUF1800 family)